VISFIYNVWLVYITSYRGKPLADLAKEVRKMSLRFPNTAKIIIDANALGEGVVEFLAMPYVDESGKEHPPFVVDTIKAPGIGVPIVRAYIGNNDRNNTGAIVTEALFAK